MDEPRSASGIGESSEALAAIGDQPPHVVAAGEASQPVVQAADTRQRRDAKRSVRSGRPARETEFEPLYSDFTNLSMTLSSATQMRVIRDC
jgi:hypothetical protein